MIVHALAREGRTAIIGDAGHRVPWERTAEFIAVVREFCG